MSQMGPEKQKPQRSTKEEKETKVKRMGELRDKWRNSALAAGEASRIIQKRQMLFSEKKGALRTADGLPDVAPIEWYIE